MIAALILCSAATLRAQAPNTPSSAPNPAKPKIHGKIWSPPNVDARLGSLSTSQSCSLPEVLARTGQRAQELVDNLQRFTADEQVQFYLFDSFDRLKSSESASYNYIANFEQRPGSFSVDETRDVPPGGKGLSVGTPDRGLPALPLIFHPYYQGDYAMRCEGAMDWNGTPAWVIHFVQRKDKPSRTRGIDTPEGEVPFKLKGRAWIAQDSYQVLHIETNLVEPVLQLQIITDAVSISYAPVEFRAQNATLWLPQSAETFTENSRGRTVVAHTFSDFLLFSVQSNQTIAKPQEKSTPPQP